MIRFGLPVTVLALILDQATKLLVHDNLWQPPRRVELLGFLDLVPVENRGISFGLFQSESTTGVWLISAFALIVSIGLGIWMSRTKRRWP
ncbi:MAG: signal peptidase II, partial [Alphaproteobacteria bacterium]